MSGKDETIPMVTDLTVRITEKGDFVGLDLACSDGKVRSVALPSALISKLNAGFLWAAEEAGRRAGPTALPDAAIGHLQSAAPTTRGVEVVGQPSAAVLDFDVGGAHVCLRLSRDGVADLALALDRWFHGR